MILRRCEQCGDLDCCEPNCPDHVAERYQRYEEQSQETPSPGGLRPVENFYDASYPPWSDR